MAGGGSSCSSLCQGTVMRRANRAAATASAAGQGKKWLVPEGRRVVESVEVEVELQTPEWYHQTPPPPPPSSPSRTIHQQRILHKPSCMSEGKP
jgi:hypothetical protein